MSGANKRGGYTGVADAATGDKLFNRLTGSEPTYGTFSVHYFYTPQNHGEGVARCLKCNCQDLGISCDVEIQGTASALSSFQRNFPIAATPTGPYYPQQVSYSSGSGGIYGHQAFSGAAQETIQPMQSLQNGLQRLSISTTSTHVRSAGGIPVNTSRGVYRTEARTVFVQNLPLGLNKSTLENYLKNFGTLVRLELPANKKPQGWARAEFTTYEEADNARKSLDQCLWSDRRITARFDKETAISGIVNETAPMVVNGSGPSYSR
ncbi:MAG: hypothetical protein M1821_007435 [Bathelium mastoideum]|nr:MAG: hypothetical protein M1821_007435 [Bathelium mastoideum]KAI9694939.1 MAG: hypothetical protein M1822_000556 [Bathelium mastoideum]